MHINFETIDYLQKGNYKQQQAYATLSDHKILSTLEAYDPILVGTIPINIDIESSDLDIICCFTDQEAFYNFVSDSFANKKNFTIRKKFSATPAIVANFIVDDFEIEIFGQSIPTKQQLAYRHMLIEHSLLTKYGETLRQEIIQLKRQGYKTEPAFAKALNLTGDPYIALLHLETNK